MAAKTPASSVTIGHMAGARIVKYTFTDIDDTDTWASGLQQSGVIGYIPVDTDDPTTQASVGCAAAYASTTGIFTFYPAEDNKSVDLYVMLRS